MSWNSKSSTSRGSFYILDPSGKQITFDFIRGGPAEKVFLKILFPVVIPHGR